MGYYFFLSYAKETPNLELMRTFVDELRTEVSALAPWPREQTGFMDVDQRRGETWDENIARALATTKTMVCMYTPAYFAKPYCGMEVELMLRRRRAFRNDHPAASPSNIIPVLWDPSADRIPRTLPPFFSSRRPDSVYETDGLRFMLQAGNYQAEYVRLKRDIARDILSAARRFPLPELEPPSMATMRDAFVPQPTLLQNETLDKVRFGPKSVLCLLVGPPDWHLDERCPFRPPSEDATAYVCAAIAERLESQAREFVLDPRQIAATDVIELVARSNGRVLVVVAASLVDTAPYAEWLRNYDNRDYRNCATIVVGDVTRARLVKAFPVIAARRPNYLFGVSQAEALANAVESSLNMLHDALASGSDAVVSIDRPTDHPSVPSLALPAA